jgi:hypothetical protein
MSELTEPRKSALRSKIIERKRQSEKTVRVSAHSARPANIDFNYRR